MRNLLDIAASYAALNENPLGEDLILSKMGDHKITLDDPQDDEIDNLEKSSPEKREKIMKDVERDMHESSFLNPAAAGKTPEELAQGLKDTFDAARNADKAAPKKGREPVTITLSGAEIDAVEEALNHVLRSVFGDSLTRRDNNPKALMIRRVLQNLRKPS